MGLGTHVWDLRAINTTKGYLQVRGSEWPWTFADYSHSGGNSELASYDQLVRCFSFLRQTLTVPPLPPAIQTKKVTRWLIYGGIIVYGLFYSTSIISNCILFMPQPGQPDDAATWMSRAQECATPSQHLALVQGVFWYSKRHLQLHTHHRRALPRPHAREIPLPVAPLLLLALHLARRLEPTTCLEQDLLRGQLAPGQAREFVGSENQ